MADFIVPADELDAINEMLESIGQTPVSSLEAPIGDVSIALGMLRRATRSCQLHGWDFNTDDPYTLTPETSGLIRVPAGVLRIDAVAAVSKLVRRRHPDGFWSIWDGDTQSWEHPEPIEFRIVWGFPFDDMPDSARHYVSMSSARRFQNRIIGASSLDGYSAEDEARAWIMLMRDERSSRDTNLFRRNATLARQTSNRRY